MPDAPEDKLDEQRRSLLLDALPAAAAAAVASDAAQGQSPADPGYVAPGVRLAFTA